jgi:hypothetical protein
MWFNLTTPVLWLLRALQIGVAMFLCSRTEQWWAGECSFAGALVPQECTASQRTCCVLGSLVASQSHGVGHRCAQPLEILEEGVRLRDRNIDCVVFSPDPGGFAALFSAQIQRQEYCSIWSDFNSFY